MPELIEDGTVTEGDFYRDISPTAIALVDGHLFDILDPQTWIFNVDVIATSLSNQCRFLGHLLSFYSIAEHSVRVSKLLEEWGEPLIVQYLGLHHDDCEAYLGDVPSPHKHITSIAGESFKSLETGMEYAYFYTLGVLTSNFAQHMERVKEADLAVYLMERDERPYPGRGLLPLMARSEYLARHQQYAWQFSDTVPRA